ncbi:putative ultraviolet-B receptor UVR8-like isoform X1 [Capsicum annuum]|uniref:Uncharacterized protein n=1 Tax=Capsicum annuum TaxID=4072 RepID=A0A2G2YJA0_CAPAN|nr:uncharacterized protein LOC107845488 [Capsicum annuum]KAF3620913.1 putative ultraviolet-B receptor UVR8-like isoform X1 [Capsicum annuum]PHT69661.1 hypothetical protein T459_24765 [Capsicum annuum]
MALQLQHLSSSTAPKFTTSTSLFLPNFQNVCVSKLKNIRTITSVKNNQILSSSSRIRIRRGIFLFRISASLSPLDLTEDNIIQVLEDAKTELAQLFDTSVGITGKAELAEVDGPYVKLRLSGKFWHKRSTVVARLGNYLKQRIPEILEVDIEDEKQLDDSPANF